MLYYGLVSAAVMMFGVQFLCNDRFQHLSGSSLRTMLKYTLISNAVGLIALFLMNKCRFEFTLYSFAVSIVAALDLILCGFCSLRALGKINLSVFSLFSMLGGMVLPFVAGIAFLGEKLTVGKAVCFVLVTAALLITLQKGKKGGAVYYIGVFIFNGLSGVIPAFYQNSERARVSELGYSVLKAAVVVVICAAWLLFNREKNVPFSRPAVGWTVGGGLLNSIANLLLLFGLHGLPASAQYSLVTGGVIIVSTLLCYCTDKKPAKKELVSVAVSFAGIAALIILD